MFADGSSGVMLSSPRRSCSSVITSTCVSLARSSRPSIGARRSGGRSGAATASGSSTSVFFWIEEINVSRMSSGERVRSAISRKAMTGFLSSSGEIVMALPFVMARALCAARRTSSKRLGILSTQSSTVTRAMRADLPLVNYRLLNWIGRKLSLGSLRSATLPFLLHAGA